MPGAMFERAVNSGSCGFFKLQYMLHPSQVSYKYIRMLSVVAATVAACLRSTCPSSYHSGVQLQQRDFSSF